MAILEAGAAFAVLMILFATIATGIVEFIHRLSGVRARHLKRALGYLFENIIWPRVGHRLPRNEGEGDAEFKARHSKNFVTALTTNPIAVLRDESNLSKPEKVEGSKELDASDYSNAKRAFAAGDIEYLTAQSFAERLARTATGKAILDEGEELIDELVTDFVRTFDRLGRAATDFVGKRARLLSVFVGIALALVANIDASRLITALVDDPVLRRGLIAQGEAAAEANKKAEEQLKTVAQAIKNGTIKEEELKIFDAAVADMKAKLAELESRGIPIGYAYYPWKDFGECDSSGIPCWLEAPGDFLRWVIMCLLSGILIGLGGPFWYEVFRRLVQVIQVARSFGIGTAKKTAKPVDTSEPAETTDRTAPTDPIDAFRVAAKVYHAATGSAATGSADARARRARKAGLNYAKYQGS